MINTNAHELFTNCSEMIFWKICGKFLAIRVENLLSFTIIHYIPWRITGGAIFSRPLSKTTHYGMLHLYWLSYRIDCSHQNPCALVGLDPLYHQRSGVALGWNPNWRWWRWKWQQDIRRANAGVAMIIGLWLNLVHDAEGRWLVTMAASGLWLLASGSLSKSLILILSSSCQWPIAILVKKSCVPCQKTCSLRIIYFSKITEPAWVGWS